MNGKQQVYQFLKQNKISYGVIEHEAVYTVDDMEALHLNDLAPICKNLFLRDARGKRHFLVVMRHDRQANLKQLQQLLGSSKLSFASEERLTAFLGLKKGAVTPLGVLNDKDAAVEFVFDSKLRNMEKVGVHPNENTATVFLPFKAVESIVKANGNRVIYVEL